MTTTATTRRVRKVAANGARYVSLWGLNQCVFAALGSPPKEPEYRWSQPGATCKLSAWQKDCNCLTHDGAHWLHVDRITRQVNREQLAQGYIMGFPIEEGARLRNKMRQMTARNLCGIPERAR